MTQAAITWQEAADTVAELIGIAESDFSSLLENSSYTNPNWYAKQAKQHEEELARYRQVLAKIKEQI